MGFASASLSRLRPWSGSIRIEITSTSRKNTPRKIRIGRNDVDCFGGSCGSSGGSGSGIRLIVGRQRSYDQCGGETCVRGVYGRTRTEDRGLEGAGTIFSFLPLMKIRKTAKRTRRTTAAAMTTGRNAESPLRFSGVGSLRDRRGVSSIKNVGCSIRHSRPDGCLLVAAGARHQLADGLFGVLVVVQDGVHLLGDGHLHAVAGSQPERGGGRADALGHLAV